MSLLDRTHRIKFNMRWNWQVDLEPGDPVRNMASDAGLLAALHTGEGMPTVRVYTWDRKAVSIGRLQSEEAVRRLYPDLPLVRRPTGGRAVVHGNDLTVTVALPLDCLPPERRSVSASHEVLVDPVKAALIAGGLAVCYGGCPIRSQRDVVNCFDLAASCDLIHSYTGEKLVGSAQRREENALLQQMSLSLVQVPDLSFFLSSLRESFQQAFPFHQF